MAQSGFTPIKIYSSSTAAAVPTAGDLEQGELAINTNDGKLFYEDSSGVVQVIATKAGATGSVTSVGGTGTVNGITLTGTVTTSGNLTLGGTLSGVSLTTQVSGTLPIANGGTGLTTFPFSQIPYGAGGTLPLSTSASFTYSGSDTLNIDGLAISRRQASSFTSTNTAIGYNTLTGSNAYGTCTAVGHNALAGNTNSGNTAVGANALDASNSGNNNTGVGVSALSNNTTATGNTAIGANALAAQTTNGSSTAVGQSAMANANAGACVAIGDNALNNAFTTVTGGHNVSIGYYNFRQLTTGTNNIGFGSHLSPYSPVYTVTTDSNRIVMGNTSITNAYVQVAWSVVSDARDKMNFAPVPHGLAFVKQLNPISYQFKEHRDIEVPHGPVRYGFKAQDILALEGDKPVIIDAEKPEKLLYNGESLVPVLVNAIKELSVQVEKMKVEIAALKG